MVLAGCSGAGKMVPTATAQSQSDKLLNEIGAYAILEGSNYIVRSDLQNQAWLQRPSYDAMMASGTRVTIELEEGGGCQGDDYGGCGGNSNSAPPPSYPIIGTVTVVYSSSSGYCSIFGTSSNLGRGPIYQFAGNLSTCVASTMAGIAGSLNDLARSLVNNPVSAALSGSATAYLGGQISATAFSDVLIAVATSAEMAELLNPIGMTIAGLALLAACKS